MSHCGRLISAALVAAPMWKECPAYELLLRPAMERRERISKVKAVRDRYFPFSNQKRGPLVLCGDVTWQYLNNADTGQRSELHFPIVTVTPDLKGSVFEALRLRETTVGEYFGVKQISSHVRWYWEEKTELQVISPILKNPKNATDIAAQSIMLLTEEGGKQNLKSFR